MRCPRILRAASRACVNFIADVFELVTDEAFAVCFGVVIALAVIGLDHC